MSFPPANLLHFNVDLASQKSLNFHLLYPKQFKKIFPHHIITELNLHWDFLKYRSFSAPESRTKEMQKIKLYNMVFAIIF